MHMYHVYLCLGWYFGSLWDLPTNFLHTVSLYHSHPFILDSNNTQRLLWYLRKDTEGTPTPNQSSTTEQDETPTSETTTASSSVYLYWAELMRDDQGPSDLLQYPSLTSILVRSNLAWEALPTETAGGAAPVVELLDNDRDLEDDVVE